MDYSKEFHLNLSDIKKFTASKHLKIQMHKIYTCMIKYTINGHALLSLQCYHCFVAVEQNICNIVVINGPQEF